MRILKNIVALVVVAVALVVLIPGVLWIVFLFAVVGGIALLLIWSFDRVRKWLR